MSRPGQSQLAQSWRTALVLIAVCLSWPIFAVTKEDPDLTDSATWPGADLFTNGAVLSLRIKIQPGDLDKLRKEPREFVPAQVEEAGALYPDVGLHLKGSIGSFRPVDDKPGLTLDFSRFRPEQKFHGLRRIHLNNSVEDPSYCNEQLGAELFRSAGVPAPRVSRAVVLLNERRLGLYVLKEGFTEDFLSCYFKEPGAGLFEPGEGHDVNQHLKRGTIRASPQKRALLKSLADAALQQDANQRWKRLETVLDVDRFLPFMALEIMICHRDGYCLARNNYRVYEDVDAGKVIFFPHGMDQLFGVTELPWKPQLAGLVARAVMDTTEGSRRYRDIFGTLFVKLFQPALMSNRVDQAVGALQPWLDKTEFNAVRKEAAALEERIVERHRFLESQLNGSSPAVLKFEGGVARLSGWALRDGSGPVKIEPVASSDGLVCLHLVTRSEAGPSCSTKALLGPGRYRFEGSVRVSEVTPLGFGIHQGAGLRIGGQQRSSEGIVGSSSWQPLSTWFEIEGNPQEREFICELRASSGDAWFDCASLRVVQVR